MRFSRYLSFLICSLFIVTGCGTSAAPSLNNPPLSTAPVIKIAGTTAAIPLLDALATAYRERSPESAFEIHSGGSRLGETQVFVGEAALVLSTLFAPPDSLLPTNTISGTTTAELVRTPIALSGLAVIIHADNPIATLSTEQLQQLYSGRVTNWNELGVEQNLGEIQLVGREEASGARILFGERVLRGKRLSLTALLAPTSAAMVEIVGQNRSAIGYVDQAYVQNRDAQDIDAPVRVVAVDDLLPDVDAIASHRYPLIYPLYLVHRMDLPRDVDAFVTWIMSEQGQSIIGQFHALPQAN